MEQAENSYEIVPTSLLAGAVLAVLFVYFIIRHFLFVFMVFDVMVGWLRQFRWFPKEGQRIRIAVHWLIAIGLLVGYFALGAQFGWLDFIAK